MAIATNNWYLPVVSSSCQLCKVIANYKWQFPVMFINCQNQNRLLKVPIATSKFEMFSVIDN